MGRACACNTLGMTFDGPGPVLSCSVPTTSDVGVPSQEGEGTDSEDDDEEVDDDLLTENGNCCIRMSH